MSDDHAVPFPPIGMSPAVWGPLFWTTMSIASLGYSSQPSNEEQTAAKQFYESLAYMIPCAICKDHYRHHLAEYPVTDAVGSRDTLIRWVFTLHNKVNAQLGKPELTFVAFIAAMRALAAQSALSLPPSCATPMLPTIGLVLAGILVGGAAYHIYTKGMPKMS